MSDWNRRFEDKFESQSQNAAILSLSIVCFSIREDSSKEASTQSVPFSTCPIRWGVLVNNHDFSVESVAEGTMRRGSQILISASFLLLKYLYNYL